MNFLEQKNYDINASESKNFCIEDASNTFLSKYYILVNQYLGFYTDNICENITINNDKKYRYFIFIKGLELFKNIMLLTLIYTNNIELGLHYCNKAYYYYIEFIAQIDTDNNHLELTIKDATIFVYKKTIFEIKESISNINNSNINKENILKIETIEKILNIINCYAKIFKIKNIINLNINKEECSENQINIDKQFFKIINKLEKLYINEIQYNNIVSNLNNILETILKVFNKFNIIEDDNNNLDSIINFSQLLVLIDKLILKLISSEKYVDIEPFITRDLVKSLTALRIKNLLLSLDEYL